MAKKRKLFRFRFPWFSEASAPRRPKDKSKSREQADTTIPIQEPPGKAPSMSPSTQALEIPIADPQQHSPSRSLQPEKSLSLTIGSPEPSQPKPESLASERTSEESRPAAIESTSLATSLSQQEKEKMVESEGEPEPEMSPLKTIPKSQELTKPETSPPVSEPISHPKESPLKTIPESQELTQPQTSPHVSESLPQPEMSPLKTIPDSQEITQPETSPHVPEPVPQPKESSLKIITKSQEGNAEDPRTDRTKAELHTKATTSETETEDPFSRVVQADRKKQDARESVERNVMFAASSSTGKDINVVSSIDPVTKRVSCTSHEKDVLSNGEKTPLKTGIKEDISKFVQKLATGLPTDPVEDKTISAITLAGENRGATMQIGSESTKKERSVHIHRAYRTDPEESPEVTTESEGEEGSDNSVEQDEVGKAYINSNIQSINNSLTYHGSVTEKDPGVQLILPLKPPQSVRSDDEDSKG